MALRVGLSGGIGSGKSTVARLLAERGAIVVDADAIAREVVEPGTAGYAAVVVEFGPDVVGPDGTLNRGALAAIVFADDARRAALNAIVHPLVGARMAELAAAAPADAVTVYDVPLIVENGTASTFDAVVIVLAGVETRLQRLAGRGMTEADARARLAVQATDDQRRAVADHLIHNDGSPAQLAAQVDAVWQQLQAHAEVGRAV